MVRCRSRVNKTDAFAGDGAVALAGRSADPLFPNMSVWIYVQTRHEAYRVWVASEVIFVGRVSGQEPSTEDSLCRMRISTAEMILERKGKDELAKTSRMA